LAVLGWERGPFARHQAGSLDESKISITATNGSFKMEGPLRGLLAGAAAWKFGGGCVSTMLIFIIVFWLLGYVHC
jgi:hypothetical protein